MVGENGSINTQGCRAPRHPWQLARPAVQQSGSSQRRLHLWPTAATSRPHLQVDGRLLHGGALDHEVSGAERVQRVLRRGGVARWGVARSAAQRAAGPAESPSAPTALPVPGSEPRSSAACGGAWRAWRAGMTGEVPRAGGGRQQRQGGGGGNPCSGALLTAARSRSAGLAHAEKRRPPARAAAACRGPAAPPCSSELSRARRLSACMVSESPVARSCASFPRGLLEQTSVGWHFKEGCPRFGRAASSRLSVEALS